MRTLLLAIILFAVGAQSQQWTNLWTSSALSNSVYSGWFSFEKTTSGWKNRMYLMDSTRFQVAQAGYSTRAQYTYNFTVADTTAGRQIYALSADFNNDNFAEFYVLQYYGPSTNYRQGYKIIDITTGNTLFERNNTSYSYSYPSLVDVDGDGVLELVHYKYDYPSFANYYYEVFSSGLSSSSDASKPITFILKQNFPNPFNPSTMIEYSLDEPAPVRIEIFDIRGELVRTLVNEYQQSGVHTAAWNGKTDTGGALPTGVYSYSLVTAGKQAARKMILLR